MLPLVLWLDLATPQLAASPFWAQLDVACHEVDKVAAAPESAFAAGGAADRDAIALYCRFGIVPKLAARPDGERRRRLEAVLGAANVPFAPPATLAPGAVTNIIVGAAEDELRHAPPPELGLVGEKILASTVAAVCQREGAKQVLAITCALPSRVSLAAVRLAVLRDLVSLVVNEAADHVPPSLRLVAAAATAEDLRAVNIAAVLGDGLCAAGTPCNPQARVVGLARDVLVRILADGPRLDRPNDHYRNVVEDVLRTELATLDGTATLDPASLVAVDELVVALRELDDERRLSAHARPTALAERMFTALRKSVLLAGRLSAADPERAAAANRLATILGSESERALAILGHVARADAKAAVYAATAALAEGGATKVSPASLRALRVAADLAQARTEADLKRAARDAVLPLPPWVDRFILDLNVSPPVNKRVGDNSELSLNGDVTIGYNGDRLGFVTSASSAYYELDAANNYALTERYAGALDVWGVVDLGRGVRIEPRLSAGGSYYGTLASDSVAGGNRQTNQDSIFLRAVGALGVRVQPGSRFAADGSFGVGAQYEDYFRVLQTSAGDQGTVFNVAVSSRWEARLRVQVTVLPQILSFRARGDLQVFEMRRSDQAVTFNVGRVTQNDQGITEISQLELFARGFLDADVLRFFGFVPSVHGGANVFSIARDGTGTTAVVPVVGVGIRREAL